MAEAVVNRSRINDYLFDKLKKQNAFWSYDIDGVDHIPDDMIIEKTLIHLDLDDINLLFMFYPSGMIKKIWRERIAIQGDYYRSMNLFLAWYYFGIKNPEVYLKSIETKHMNSFL